MARTPFDHEFRKEIAWREGRVGAACGCPHIDGVQEGDHVVLLRGSMDYPRTCPQFELDRARVSGSDMLECCKVDAGMYDAAKSHDGFIEDVRAVESRIDEISSRVSALHSEAKRLMDERRTLEEKRDGMFLHRYDCVPGISRTLARMAGAILGSEHDFVRGRSEAIGRAGYVPFGNYDVPVFPTKDALARLLASGLVDDADLDNYDAPFTMIMTPVEVWPDSGMVRLVESQACFALRLTSPVYTILFGDRKYAIRKEIGR